MWKMDPRPSEADSQGAAKLITVFGRDPVYDRPADSKLDLSWMCEPITGLAHPQQITLDEGQEKTLKVQVRLHEVTYDADRDMYYAEVAWPADRGNKFVRLAVARFQEKVTSGNSQLSLIRTVDPVKLLPARTAIATNATTTKFSVSVTGAVDIPDTADELSRVRVSLQEKIVPGDPDIGWDTVATKEVVLDPANGTYPKVSLDRPTGGATHRILVEEYESWTSLDKTGGLVNNTYQQIPETPRGR